MSGILIADFILVLMIFLRVAAALTVAPVFSNSVIPVKVRIFLAIIIAYMIFMTMDKSNITIKISLGWMILNGIKESDFCLGKNNSGWKVDFDWIISNDTNYLKVLEGKYKGANNGTGKRFVGEFERNAADKYKDM